MAKKTCEWFLEPLDDFTNEAIARVMADRCDSDASSVSIALKDNRGKLHNVWHVDYPTVGRFQKSRQSVRFKVFTRQEGSLLIRPWPFGKKPQRRGQVSQGISK